MKIRFDSEFRKLTGFKPLKWQSRLFREYLKKGKIPAAIDIPTGLGKTSVMAIWYLAHQAGACLPRRLVYVVDRRAVVDQATTVAEEIKKNSADKKLRVSTLRGQHVDNREWLEDPIAPAIIVGTVDMIGSRLLFSGYGVSRKMRPYHAGMLGADALLVLDESHLVPPFERLLDAIENDNATFAPRDQLERGIVPPFRLLSLSATGRARNGAVFGLEEKKGDLDDDVVRARLGAKKYMTIESANGRKLEEALSERAWALSGDGQKAVRILVYCDSRDVAEKVKKAIAGKSKGDKKNDVPKSDIETELFVGARRVKERVDAAESLKRLGFLAGSNVRLGKPAFLVATSAGEVGVDLDADHMVCDLVPWERMVQRLGRVNRLGTGNAKVVLVHEDEPKPKKPDDPSQKELREMIAWRNLQLLEKLQKKSGINVNPGALRKLKQRAERDSVLQANIEAATTPPPLYPALTRALADAWSMTSLEKHTGRPEVAPWLRGWVDDDPRTSVVWRKYLPIRIEGSEASTKEVDNFFDAAPPHLSEKLETETWRVVDWLMTRAGKTRDARVLRDEEVVAFTLAPDDDLLKKYRIDDLITSSDDKDHKKRLERELSGATLIVDARSGGLKDGLLDSNADGVNMRTADDGGEWPVDTGFHISAAVKAHADANKRVTYSFATKLSAEGEDIELLLIKTETTQDALAASSQPQLLEEHLSLTEKQTRRIAKANGLTGNNAKALAIAGRLHDEGKKAARWQQAFNAPQKGIYAKTSGPLVLSRLGGYRHEFGSLPYAEQDEAFKRLPLALQELVLHLIAAHHGYARPLIATKGCDDAPPSLLEARARDVALRTARLQKLWGPWGLAWWEALLRAADQQASRENDVRRGTNGRS